MNHSLWPLYDEKIFNKKYSLSTSVFLTAKKVYSVFCALTKLSLDSKCFSQWRKATSFSESVGFSI